jgi:hypothetical protein
MSRLPLVLRNAIAATIVDALAERRHVETLAELARALAPAGGALPAASAPRLIATGAFASADGRSSGGPADETSAVSASAGGSRAPDARTATMHVVVAPALAAARAAGAARVERARVAVDAYWRDAAGDDSPSEAAASDALAVALPRAAVLFDARLYFEVHEVLEAAWNRLQGAPRTFVQGLLQIAVALHHLEESNARGACTLFAAGREKLAPYAPEYQGVRVAALLAEVVPWERAAAESGGWPADLALPRLRVG